MMRRLRMASRLLCGCSLMGCAMLGCTSVGPEFSAPHEAVPDRFAGAPAPPPGTPGAPEKPAGPQPSSFWWREFHDPELDRLESAAARENLDLKVAYLRFVESRLQVQQARAQGLPSLNASAKYTREQLGIAGILKAQGLTPGPTTAASTSALISSLEQPVNIWQVGFDASWELDLFGKVRRTVEAANAASTEALESRNDLLVTLQAEVAQTYLQLRGGQVLERVTRDQIAAQREVLELTRSRQMHGLAGEADVESAQAQLSNLESDLPPYDQSVASARHALAVLTGQPPEALDAEFAGTGELPALPQDVDAGVPATLARRRPDIRSSEAALHAATAQIGVSVAALFPDISLTGNYGLRNTGTRYLFDWASRFYTVAPQISLPIFHGGALIASVRLSKAEAVEAAVNYRKTVLSALQEVEDGLTAVHDDAARTSALKETVAADERAVAIDLDGYKRGLITYLSVLTVQLQAVAASQQLAEAMLTQSTDLVKLYKALGGGWENNPDVADGSRSAAAGAP
jgi:NodT family efflux transporter outer membrane factor (OMF) lipoprotein